MMIIVTELLTEVHNNTHTDVPLTGVCGSAGVCSDGVCVVVPSDSAVQLC